MSYSKTDMDNNFIDGYNKGKQQVIKQGTLNVANLYALDIDNLLRAVNPQTELEVILYERLYQIHKEKLADDLNY